MLHLLYILAFTGVALLAVGNLVRNLMTLGVQADRANATQQNNRQPAITMHPEMLDDAGKPIREPLLVMKSMTVDDARDHLNAIYKASPGGFAGGDPSDE